MNTDRRSQMSEALDAVRRTFPNQPILILVAFPTDENTTQICTGANMSTEDQFSLLSSAMEIFEPAPKDTTLQ